MDKKNENVPSVENNEEKLSFFDKMKFYIGEFFSGIKNFFTHLFSRSNREQNYQEYDVIKEEKYGVGDKHYVDEQNEEQDYDQQKEEKNKENVKDVKAIEGHTVFLLGDGNEINKTAGTFESLKAKFDAKEIHITQMMEELMKCSVADEDKEKFANHLVQFVEQINGMSSEFEKKMCDGVIASGSKLSDIQKQQETIASFGDFVKTTTGREDISISKEAHEKIMNAYIEPIREEFVDEIEYLVYGSLADQFRPDEQLLDSSLSKNFEKVIAGEITWDEGIQQVKADIHLDELFEEQDKAYQEMYGDDEFDEGVFYEGEDIDFDDDFDDADSATEVDDETLEKFSNIINQCEKREDGIIISDISVVNQLIAIMSKQKSAEAQYVVKTLYDAKEAIQNGGAVLWNPDGATEVNLDGLNVGDEVLNGNGVNTTVEQKDTTTPIYEKGNDEEPSI